MTAILSARRTPRQAALPAFRGPLRREATAGPGMTGDVKR
jgi:hypothetical protein